MYQYSSNISKNEQNNRWLALVLIVTFLLSLWILSSYLWDKYRVVRDVQNFYWMARARDATLFSVDYLYISGRSIIETNILGFNLLLYPFSLGYGLFFYVASTVLDYIWLTKLSILILVPLSVIYLFKLGRFLKKDESTGISLSLIFIFFALASPLSTSIVSGLQRAYSIPLLIVFVYYLLRQKYIWAALLIFVSTLIYLPNFPPMVLAYGFSLINIKRSLNLSLNLNRAVLMPFAISLLFSTVIVILALAVQLDLLSHPSPPVFGGVPTNLEVSENPVYQSGGSMALFIGFPFLGRAGIFDTGGDVTNFLVLSIFAALIYKIVGRQSFQQLPKEIWYLA